MRILVIGGAGYIGSHVVLSLLENGDEVCVFDNLSSGLRQNLQSEADFFHGDILLPDSIEHCIATNGPFDAVVHLAALKAAGESMLQPEKYSVHNLTGTINILNAMAEAGIGNMVFSSSAATYGEPQYLPIDENHAQKPENYYGFTKLEIERILEWYSKLRNIRFAALRYFNAAGYDIKGRITGLEMNPANLLPIIMEVAAGQRETLQIFGDDYDTDDGSCIRDYVHVSDLADGHVRALKYIGGEHADLMINLGSETGISVMEMLESARRICGVEIPAVVSPRRPGDPAKTVASSARAHELLGWKAEHSSVDELVTSTWQVYKKNFGQ